MTDQEIIQGLIDRDNRITERFFFVKCRPLFNAVMRLVFSYPVDYNEMVAELYQYLMEDDARKLRLFQFRSSVYQWIKVIAIRFFIHKRDSLIDDSSKEPLYDCSLPDNLIDSPSLVAQKIDIEFLLRLMENQRYADVIRHLILRDEKPEKYARSIGISVDNLYNIKRRAIAALSRIALKYYSYGR